MEHALLRSSLARNARTIMRLARVLGAAVVVLLPVAAQAQLPAPQLHALFPAGGRQGTIVEVRLAAGTDVDGANRLVFSHPHITAVQKTRPPGMFEKGAQGIPSEFTVAIHPDVPPGIYEARSVGRFGISNPRAFAVGNLPEQREPTDNRSADKAATIQLGTITNGTADATANDYFKIPLKKDERVILDCWAERLDSRMDATLAIYDTSGRELAHDRDTNRRDPLLAFTAPADGEYVIKLYDFLYRGGNDYFYRLLVSKGPYIDYVLPPVALAGAKTGFTLFGSNLPGGGKVEGLISRGRTLEQLAVEIEAPAGDAATGLALNSLLRPQEATLDGFEYRLTTPAGESNPILIGYAAAPVVAEQEPNDDPAKPQQVTVPCTFVGHFSPRGDYDWISFEAKKGDTYWIDTISQRLGLSTDPYVLIQRVTTNDKGALQATDVQELDDTGKGSGIPSFRPESDDPAYRFVAPEDGTYRILVRDLYGGSRGDPRLVYALEIRTAAPDFRLAAVPVHHVNVTAPADSVPGNPLLRRGGTEMINVIAMRRDDFAGDIDITVEGLPPSVTAGAAIIPAGQNNTTVVLRAAEDAPAWAGTIRILGKAKIADKDVVRVARAAAVEWPSPINQPPESRLARDLWLAVLDLDTAPFLADLGEGKTWEMSRAGKLEIPIKIVRRGDMKQPVTLTPIGLPPNVKGQVTLPAPDASEGKLALDIGDKARPGIYNFRLQAQASVSYRRDPQTAEAAAATKQEIDKAAAELGGISQQVEQARAAADKLGADTAAAAKQTAESAQGELQKSTAAAEAAKVAVAKLAQAKDALEKDSTNQELVQAKDAADKAASDAQSLAQTASAAAAAAEKAAAEALVRSQAAAADKAAKDKLAAEAAAKAKAATDAKAAADKRAADTAKAAEAKNVNLFETSTSVTLQVTNAPLTLNVTAPPAFKPGTQAEIPVAIARLYGYADPVDVQLIVPEAPKTLSSAKLALAAGQSEGKIAIMAAAEAPPGKHTLTARASFMFGGQDFKVEQPVIVEIAAPQ
jgi:hypothetical protein